MRELFRNILKEQQALAKNERFSLTISRKAQPLTPEQKQLIETQREATKVSLATMTKVYALQREKARLVHDLEEDFARIDRGQPPLYELRFARPVSYEWGNLVTTWKDGQGRVTIGQLIGDHVWREYYLLDHRTVPKPLQKQYALAIAKERIWMLAQKQIVIHESEALEGFNKHVESIPKVYQNLVSKGPRGSSPGILAEKMIYSLLKRIEVDTGIPFRTHRADVYQDAMEKIDLWLSHAGASEDADLSTAKTRELQVALRSSREKRQDINQQRNAALTAETPRDIIFFGFPRELVLGAYAHWMERGRPPGGPAMMLSVAQVQDLVQRALDGFLAPQELDGLPAKIDGLGYQQKELFAETKRVFPTFEEGAEEEDPLPPLKTQREWEAFISSVSGLKAKVRDAGTSLSMGVRTFADETRTFEGMAAAKQELMRLYGVMARAEGVTRNIVRKHELFEVKERLQKWLQTADDQEALLQAMAPTVAKAERLTGREADQAVRASGDDELRRINEALGKEKLSDEALAQHLADVEAKFIREQQFARQHLADQSAPLFRRSQTRLLAMQIVYRRLEAALPRQANAPQGLQTPSAARPKIFFGSSEPTSSGSRSDVPVQAVVDGAPADIGLTARFENGFEAAQKSGEALQSIVKIVEGMSKDEEEDAVLVSGSAWRALLARYTEAVRRGEGRQALAKLKEDRAKAGRELDEGIAQVAQQLSAGAKRADEKSRFSLVCALVVYRRLQALEKAAGASGS